MQILLKQLELGDGVYWMTEGQLEIMDVQERRAMAIVSSGGIIGTLAVTNI